jgi:flagellar hook protein FlgE
MGLQSALSTALTGLSAAETTIDVVGNNLANANTVGFKASQATFATQFLQTRSLGSGPTANRGGTNPRQVGLGTMVAGITPNFTQGTVSISATPTDMAIQGDGFFMVDGARSGGIAYTRNGVFKLNAVNQLTTATGNRVLGYGVNDQFVLQTTGLVPITIPLGSAAVAKATENVFMGGTLKPDGDIANAARIIQTSVLGDAGYTHPESADLPTIQVSGPPDATGVARTAINDPAGLVATGDYYYRFVFADGPTGGALNLEGMPSAATSLVHVDNATSNAVNLTNLNSLLPGSGTTYQYIHIYRSDSATGAFNYIDSVNVGTASYVDRSAAGTTVLDSSGFQNEQFSYYIAYGKSGSDPSRPSSILGPYSPNGGRIHITDLQVPTDNPNAWDSWIIYRNAPNTAGNNRYFEVAQIPFTTTTPYFTDNTPDATLYTDDDHHRTEINMDGPTIQRSTLLNNVTQYNGSTYEQVFSRTGLLDFNAYKGGAELYRGDPRQLLVTSTTTVGDLMDFMVGALGIQPSNSTTGIPPSVDSKNPMGAPIPPGAEIVGGRIQITGNNGVDNAIDIKTSGLLWDGTANTVNLAFAQYQAAVGESVGADLTMYDSLGILCSGRMTAVLESTDINAKTTTYRWFADSKYNYDASSAFPKLAVGTGTITFDSEGRVIATTTPSISIHRDNVASASPLQVNLDFSALSGLETPTSTLSETNQDGAPPGTLSSFIAGEDGVITGVFSNGEQRTLGQIVLAKFSNPAGLQQLGENLYTTGMNSGMPVQGNPGQNGIGSLVGGAVELSNTDVGGNLIDLILASTMYRGNTKVITTVQQMLDTLLQLQR